MKVVIIGGVAGGASAAARIRRLDEKAEIIMLERSGFVSYANCGLPYYVGGVIEDRAELALQSPESFWSRFRVQVRVRHEATAIDAKAHVIRVRALESGECYEESYDKLILAPGATAIRPPVPGLSLEKVFTLRTVEDTFRIRDYIEAEKPKRAMVIGGGFIGLEMAENLREAGLEVDIVESAPQLMGPLDADMAAQVHALLKRRGVKLHLQNAVSSLQAEADGGLKATLADGQSLCADFAVLAVGVSPDTALAREAGLELGLRASIVVNERMETSLPDIYAVGDAVEIRHVVSGRKALVPLAGPANKQGRIAADNICGGESRYRGALGSSILRLFSQSIASTGLNERAAKEAGFDYEKVVLFPGSHAGYYPGASPMCMKVLFEKGTWKLLGAQIVGGEGVDKRIDVLATALWAGMDALALKELDLAYAPPYSSAKDPVNMAGFMIDNIAAGRVKQFHWHDLETLPKDGSVTLLDARTVGEYAMGHAPGFELNIPVDELREQIARVPAGKPVYVMCFSGLRSYIACRILAQHGFDCYNFSGGYRFYAIAKADGLCE